MLVFCDFASVAIILWKGVNIFYYTGTMTMTAIIMTILFYWDERPNYKNKK